MAHALLLLQPSAVAALCCCSRREVLSVALCCYSRSVEGVLALLVVAHVAVVGLPRSDHAHARELAVLQGQRSVFGVALCCCSRREVQWKHTESAWQPIDHAPLGLDAWAEHVLTRVLLVRIGEAMGAEAKAAPLH